MARSTGDRATVSFAQVRRWLLRSPDASCWPTSAGGRGCAQAAEFAGVRPDRAMSVLVAPQVQPAGPQPTPERVPADAQTPGQPHRPVLVGSQPGCTPCR